jgi:NAD(P)H-dependent flavin oxidoreductase YrpB (nitropropane dioxygenase family)
VIESAPTGKGLVVDELELALTISAEGEVGIIASVSAGVEASIKLKLKRPAG